MGAEKARVEEPTVIVVVARVVVPVNVLFPAIVWFVVKSTKVPEEQAPQSVEVPVASKQFPLDPLLFTESKKTLERVKLVLDAFTVSSFVAKALPADNPVADRLVVDALVTKLLVLKNPDEERFVVDAFEINAIVVVERVNAASVVVELVKIPVVFVKEDMKAFVENRFPDTLVVEAFPVKVFVNDAPVAERFVVDALDINAFVAKSPLALKLVVLALVLNNDAKNAPVADKLVVDAFVKKPFVNDSPVPEIDVEDPFVNERRADVVDQLSAELESKHPDVEDANCISPNDPIEPQVLPPEIPRVDVPTHSILNGEVEDA